MDALRGERSVRHGRMWPHTDGGAAAARRHALACVRVQSAERTCKRAVRGRLRTGAFEEAANQGRSVAERSPSALAAHSRGGGQLGLYVQDC